MTDDSVARLFLEDIIISVRKQNTDYIYQWESNKKKKKQAAISASPTSGTPAKISVDNSCTFLQILQVELRMITSV